MSKYSCLWNEIVRLGMHDLQLTFEDIEKILRFPIDHSFLNYKKELEELGFRVKKISMKNRVVYFEKI